MHGSGSFALAAGNSGIELTRRAGEFHAPLKIDRAGLVGGFRGRGRIRPERERQCGQGNKGDKIAQ
jgi:hypothetical protein